MQAPLFVRTPLALVLAALLVGAHAPLASAVLAQQPAVDDKPAPALTPAKKLAAPTELFEIVKVVDGDTIHVRRKGEIEKLRLLSVDTEERLGNGVQGSTTKPQTVFGEECALWAQKFFADLGHDGQPPRVGLLFPRDPLDPISTPRNSEKKDVYGRLLCHVILPDGSDYDLLLVELGKSPYFNKYGNSTVDHEAFVAAQKRAQERQLGIWSPHANEPKTPGAPAAKRPYRELLDWWDARALAIDGFRKRQHEAPLTVIDCENPQALALAAKSAEEVEVFGEIGQLFDETSGDQTVLFRATSKDKALRVRIPAGARAKHAELDLEGLTREFRQNYAYVKGRLASGERGFEIVSLDPARWRRAGPEPKLYVAPAKQ